MTTLQIQVRGVSFCANLLGAGEFTLPAPGILKVAVKEFNPLVQSLVIYLKQKTHGHSQAICRVQNL